MCQGSIEVGRSTGLTCTGSTSGIYDVWTWLMRLTLGSWNFSRTDSIILTHVLILVETPWFWLALDSEVFYSHGVIIFLPLFSGLLIFYRW